MSTVLIVEDNELIRMTLALTIAELAEEVTVLEAGDGETGLEMALRHRPAVVLIDGWLPGLDGPSLIRKVRASGNTRCVFIGMTGTDSGDPIYRALEESCDQFLKKPFSLETIEAIVRPYL